ncbi:CBU_0585 family protein [Legionella worsleiensis]|uniref:Uncharacterized protein n=1 Tax=Legionella worsleiensis TaxID=45076 RepID=A0A0W1AAA2_9GAMM|nr:CBU_0585 family protein [Legionella worsleiensis]KTD78215.1 hypothetical protein Lwor_1610 [Legionella worsleiensis]STY32552.1 Uncharacterised protein [Legionella worsleiensis]
MTEHDLDKAYVSPYDKFLYEFDATHKKSASQIKEIQKHQKIAQMRDDKDYKDNKGEIWEAF